MLGDGADLFAAAYGVTEEGNWEGVTILSRVASDADLAERFGLAEEDVDCPPADARRSTPARRGRPPAARARRQGTGGLERAGHRGPRRRVGRAGRVGRRRRRPGTAPPPSGPRRRSSMGSSARMARFGRSWKDGRAVGSGVLEDYTHLADGLLALYEATFDERWFDDRAGADGPRARPLRGSGRRLLRHRRRPRAAGDPTEGRPGQRRPVGQRDGRPRSAATCAPGPARARYRDAAERALRTVVPFVARYPTGFAQWLAAMDLAVAPIVEVAIVGASDDPCDGGAPRRGARRLPAEPGRRRLGGPGRERDPAARSTASPSMAVRRPMSVARSCAGCRSRGGGAPATSWWASPRHVTDAWLRGTARPGGRPSSCCGRSDGSRRSC